jgi:hypothetical protein
MMIDNNNNSSIEKKRNVIPRNYFIKKNIL